MNACYCFIQNVIASVFFINLLFLIIYSYNPSHTPVCLVCLCYLTMWLHLVVES